MRALEVFTQNDGAVTKRYYEELSKLGPAGRIATALFRAQKRSSRAKDYRHGKFRRAAYDVKQWSLDQLCREMEQHGERLGFRWGWKEDSKVLFGERASFVLYCDIPAYGQVSFHSPQRGTGPDYPGEWDGLKDVCATRIVQYCDSVWQGCSAKVVMGELA